MNQTAQTASVVVAFVVGVTLNIALLAYLARRLLNTSFSLTRLVVAGAIGESAVSPIITSLIGGKDARTISVSVAVWFVILGFSCAVLAAMVVLVLWEAFIPTGTIPSAVYWGRGIKARFARTRRYWQITRLFVRHGLGPYLRGRVGPRPEPALARSLTEALEQGGVTFVKLGQVLSTRRDLLPPEFVAELGRLQDDAAAVPWEEIEPVLRAELGAPVEEIFADFDRSPLAAASVGQVHTARLRTGEAVVVKIQRPGVAAIVERDLDIVGRLARTIRDRAVWGRSIGIVELANGFAVALREELDFRVEMRNMASVAAAANARNGGSTVVIPRPYEDLCTARVLVMQRLDGTPLSKAGELIDAAGLDRSELARTLLDTLLRQIMMDGVFHADPHPGNIMLLGDGRLGLLDFGSVGRLDSELRSALQRMLLAMDKGDPVALTDAILEVMARPDELDEQSLERALGAFMVRYLGAGQTPDVRMFTDLFRIVARYDLGVPAEFAAVFRALATLEGGLAELAPGFDVVAEARAFGGTYAHERLRPSSVREAATDELVTLLPMLRRLPRRLDRITAALEGGRLTVGIRLFSDERDRRTAAGLLQQVLLTILASTAGIMAVLLLGLRGGPAMTRSVSLYQFFGYCLLVVCSILALRVLVIVFRPGSR